MSTWECTRFLLVFMRNRTGVEYVQGVQGVEGPSIVRVACLTNVKRFFGNIFAQFNSTYISYIISYII